MSTPLVSIHCPTYKHEQYIRDCLEGFLSQKTTFPFEVLIHDDASPDATPEIIKEYAAKYPDIVKPILRETNIHSVPGHRSIKLTNLERAQGKYVAFCEGDDFWCNPYKLQKQFDLLESNPDYVLCGCGIYYLNHLQKTYTPQGFPADEWPLPQDIACKRIFFNTHPFHTAAIFFRMDTFRAIQDVWERDAKNAPMGDTQLFYHFSTKGKLGYIRERLVTYRQHASSFSSYDDAEKARKFAQRSLEAHVRMANNINRPEWADEFRKLAEAKLNAPPTALSISGFFREKISVMKRVIRGDYANFRKYLALSPAERVRMFAEL